MENISSTKIKYLFVAPRFHTNQIEIIKTLLEENALVIFLAAREETIEDHSILDPIIIDQSKFSKMLINSCNYLKNRNKYYFPNIIKLIILLKKQSPCYVIIRDPQTIFSIITAIVSLVLRYRIIFYSQFVINKKISCLKRYYLYFMTIIFNAAWYSPLIDLYGKEKKIKNIFYVPFTVKKNFNFKSVEKSIKIVTIGKYKERRKNIDKLILAISKINDCNIYLDIYGECSNSDHEKMVKKLKDLVIEKGLENNIRIYKNIEHQRMLSYYQNYDLFILPAVNEVASISVLEAIASGVPVICTDSCGTRYYIKDGYNGFIVKSNDVDNLVNTIKKFIYEYKVLKKPFRMNCKEYYESHISRKNYYSAFLDMIKIKWKNTI